MAMNLKSRIKLLSFKTYCKRSRACFSHKTPLTTEKFPLLKRGNFAFLNDADLSHFEKLLSKNQILTNASDLEIHNVDWLNSCRGSSQLLLKPSNTEQLSAILQYCSEKRLAVCPQGGNTGLVGGSVPVFDEIILSTALMNKIIKFDSHSGVLQCQAGCILDNLNNYVSEREYVMPLDLGAKGSCHIGGNVATNAGGIHFVRYGSLHGNILGLEVALANGDVLDCLSTMKKDNTGYDLKQLFIGSEGTLGIITKVALFCPPKPQSQVVSFLGCTSFENILLTYRAARKELNEVLSSIEYLDHGCIVMAERNLKLKSIISKHPFYVLIEVAGSNAKHDEEKLQMFVERALRNGLVADGVFLSEPSHIKKVWELRERLTEALKADGYVYKYDISIPMQEFDNLVTLMGRRLNGQIRSCIGYGHLGDSNLHLNITSARYDETLERQIEPFIYEKVQEYNGSISAEHGIGFKKRNFMHFSKSLENLAIMKKIKNLLDPQGILNPYKMFRE